MPTGGAGSIRKRSVGKVRLACQYSEADDVPISGVELTKSEADVGPSHPE